MSKMVDWLDFSPELLFLVPHRLSSGRVVLSLIGELTDDQKAQVTEKLGFKIINDQMATTTRFVENNRLVGLRASLFLDIFPNVKLRKMPEEDRDNLLTYYNARKREELRQAELRNPAQTLAVEPNQNSAQNQRLETMAPVSSGEVLPEAPIVDATPSADEQELSRIKSLLNSDTLLGTNHLGEKVYEVHGLRYVQSEQDIIEIPATESDDRGLRVMSLMRFNSSPAINTDIVASNIIQEMANGKSFGFDELKRIAATWFNTDVQTIESRPDSGVAVYLAVQRSVESSLAHFMRNSLSNDPERNVMPEFMEMYMRRPSVPHSYILQSKRSPTLEFDSCHPQLSLAVKTFMDQLPDNARVHIPFLSTTLPLALTQNFDASTITYTQTGSVGVSKLGGLARFGVECRNVQQNLIESIGIEDHSADALILIAPHEHMPSSQIIDGVEITRYEHKFAIDALRAVKDNAPTMLIMPGETNLGLVDEACREFHNYLHQAFDNVDSADFFIGTSAEAPHYRIYQVSGRRMVLDRTIDASSEVKVIHAVDELFVAPVEPKPQHDGFLPVQTAQVRINAHQSNYLPLSRGNSDHAAIPKNLAVPQQIAFERIRRDHQDIDAFVANKLQYSLDELHQHFDAEQIDAIAFSLWRDDQGKAFLLADDTGQGKTRILAAKLRFSALNGRNSVFLTGRDFLLQDLWNSLADINSQELFKPFLMNHGARLLDSKNSDDVIFVGHNRKVDELVRNNTVPNDTNLILATYSQLSQDPNYKKGEFHNKSTWLAEVCQKWDVIFDESHLAAGESKLNLRVRSIIRKSPSLLYSSGTWAKTQKFLSSYAPLFPSIPADSVQSAVEKDGDIMLELMSAALVSDGAMIRREKDYTGIKFDTDSASTKPELLQRNIELQDAVSAALHGIMLVCGPLDKVIRDINEDNQDRIKQMLTDIKNSKSLTPTPAKKDFELDTTNFSSLMLNINKALMLSLNCEIAADSALKALSENKKPTLYVEFTGTEMLQRLYEEQQILVSKGLAPDDFSLDSPPQFRDLVHNMLNSALNIERAQSLGGQRKVPITELLSELPAEFQENVERARSLIDAIPDHPYMPIDSIRHKLIDAGYTVGEVGARKLRIEKTDDGRFLTQQFKETDRAETIRGYNDGQIDVLIGSKPLSEGANLHASPAVGDKRVRVAIEVETSRNISDRVHFLGRFDRLGQVAKPEFKTIGTGLVGQERFLAMSNASLTRMTANLTSSTDNPLFLDTVNMMNPVGDMVTFHFLESNPEYVQKLGLEAEDLYSQKLTKTSVASLARTVFGRVTLLKHEDQAHVYDLLVDEYKAYINTLDMMGENPFKQKEYDWQCIEIDRSLYRGVKRSHYDSEFDRPVELVEVQYIDTYTPFTVDSVLERIEQSAETLEQDERLSDGQISSLREIIEERRLKTFAILSEGDEGLAQRIVRDNEIMRSPDYHDRMGYTPLRKDDTYRLIINVNSMYETLLQQIDTIEPGTIVTIPPSISEDLHLNKEGQNDGVVVNIMLPKMGSEHNPSQYSVEIAIPGEDKTHIFNLDQINRNAHKIIFQDDVFDDTHNLAVDFDISQQDSIKRTALLLEGNIFKASIEAAEEGIGKPIFYTDEVNNLKRAVLVSSSLTKSELLHKPTLLSTPEMAIAYLHAHDSHNLTNQQQSTSTDGVMLRMAHSKDRYILDLPTTARINKRYEENLLLRHALNNREFDKSRSKVYVEVFENELTDAMDALYQMGIKFFTKENGREWLNKLENGQIDDKSPLIQATNLNTAALTA